ncbi:unnamed protein product [Rodentolepis nana]|uniref:PCM1_C domain-containing protein n=1 Tax=Rodentolepis nana TaxID=102285 RepID=A0A0R3T7U2_RODNA|nr:unnamed protein product [Rodentolepis nana]
MRHCGQRRKYNSENASNDESPGTSSVSPPRNRQVIRTKRRSEEANGEPQSSCKRERVEESSCLRQTLDEMTKRFNELIENLMSDYIKGSNPSGNIKAMMAELLNVYQVVDSQFMKLLGSITRSIAFIDDIEDELKSSANQSQFDLGKLVLSYNF